MNSPDTTRLAAALAKLDDPEIITLLLEAYRPSVQPTVVTMNATPAKPVQQELLGHIQDRKRWTMEPTRRRGRRWTRSEEMHLTSLYNAGHDDAEIGAALGRSRQAVEERRHDLKLFRTAR